MDGNMNEKKNYWYVIFIPLLVGGLSSLLTREGMRIYDETAIKPALNPPNIVFAIVWPILYLLLGYSLYRVYNSDYLDKNDATIAFVVNLVLNFLWSPIFFNMRAYTIGSVILVALIVSVIIIIYTFSKADKIAGLLQFPYLIWLMFALYLNIAADRLN